MLERADQKELVQKVGGVFKLCSIIQKRMRELVMGARPLVEIEFGEKRDLLAIVLREIEENKISIAEEGEASVDLPFSAEFAAMAESVDLDELRSVVSEDDLSIRLPGEDEEEEEDDDSSDAGSSASPAPSSEASSVEEEDDSEDEDEEAEEEEDFDAGDVDTDEEDFEEDEEEAGDDRDF